MVETWLLSTQWSPWLILFSAGIAAALSWIVYHQTLPALPRRWRWILGILRTLALTLLFLLLAEPVLSFIYQKLIPPQIAILLDNSISVSIQDATLDRRQQYRSVINQLRDQLNESTQIWKFDVHSSPLPTLHFDSLQLNGERTDISGALAQLITSAEEHNIQAVLLLTDGNANTGDNPLYPAERLGRPIYSIIIGDTTSPKDLQIQALITNELAYVGTPIPVSVVLRTRGITFDTTIVKLFADNRLIEQQTLSIHPHSSSYTLRFAYTPEKAGIHRLTVAVDSIPGELTATNNRRSTTINVLETKRTILIVAGAPYPDISFVRNALLSYPEVEILTRIQKRDGSFFEGPLADTVLQKTELLILIGYPTSHSSIETLHRLRSLLQRRIPLLFISSRQIDYQKLQILDLYLPFRINQAGTEELLVLPHVEPTALYHPVMKITGGQDDHQWWNQLPPVFRTDLFVTPKAGAEILATVKIGNRTFPDPLIIARSFQHYRSLAVLGYNLYRWKLLGYAAERAKGRVVPDVFTQFIRNTFQWLTAVQPEKLVRIRPSKAQYARGETVDLIAQVYDEAFNPINDAQIQVHIQSDQTERTVSLLPLGSGRYVAHLEGLPSGSYHFRGTVTISGKIYGRDTGKFFIGDRSLEYQDLRANYSLLQHLANRTGGKVFFPSEIEEVREIITRHPRFQARSRTQAEHIPLWQNIGLIVFIIALFGFEWFVRKQRGLL